MSQSERLVGAVGLIRIDKFEITITPLSQAEEQALDRALYKAAEAAAGDPYTRCKPTLDAMKDAPADRIEVLREIARMANSKSALSPAAVIDYRFSAEGVALELFLRGKKATPGLTLDGLRAIITDVNADELSVGLAELIEGGDPKPTR